MRFYSGTEYVLTEGMTCNCWLQIFKLNSLVQLLLIFSSEFAFNVLLKIVTILIWFVLIESAFFPISSLYYRVGQKSEPLLASQ